MYLNIKIGSYMKSYIQGFITGVVFLSSFIIFNASNSGQSDVIENEIIKIWKKEDDQDRLIRNNESKVLSLQSEVNIHSKSINLYLKSLQKQIDKLTNQLNEHCECYRNQILMH